jgi:hypothetical protein
MTKMAVHHSFRIEVDPERCNAGSPFHGKRFWSIVPLERDETTVKIIALDDGGRFQPGVEPKDFE